MNTVWIGKVEVGKTPRVVGTITTRASLPSSSKIRDFGCDIVEVRLDLIGADTPNWLSECQAIEATGSPVLLTLRSVLEGGRWTGPDQDRLPFITAALESLSCVDVELASGICDAVCSKAAKLGRPVIVSYHNFDRTPALEELENILGKMRKFPAAVPKISTMVTGADDIETLKTLIRRHAGKANGHPASSASRVGRAVPCPPVCVIGMGVMATETRVSFAKLGSCLTYGYIDSTSAPGQLPARELRERLANKSRGSSSMSRV